MSELDKDNCPECQGWGELGERACFVCSGLGYVVDDFLKERGYQN